MNKFFFNLILIIFFLLISTLISTLFWNFIQIPYSENNLIYSDAFVKKINPKTNFLRVFFFLFLPIFFFLFLEKHLFRSYNLDYILQVFKNNSHKKKYFLHNKKNNYLNKVTIFLFILISLEFFFLDFSQLLFPIDIFHDGLFLSPPINYIKNKNLWLSTYFEYGLFGNNLSLLIWSFLESTTIGSSRILYLFLIFLNKCCLILISRKITLFLDLEKKQEIFFFIFFTLSCLSLTTYFQVAPYFSQKSFFFLFFLIFVIYNIHSSSLITNFIIGFFSSISLLWFYDIGIFINLSILLILILKILEKSIKNIIEILVGVFFSWIFILILLGLSEIHEFFFQFKTSLRIFSYLNFIEFPKPFSDDSHSFRALKLLLFIIINGFFLIYFFFSINNNYSYEFKILQILIYFSSLILFVGALLRPDSYHLRYSSGLILLLLLLNFFYFFLKKKIFINSLINTIIFQSEKKLLFFLFFLFFFINQFKTNESISFNNNIYKNFERILYTEDIFFLNYNVGLSFHGRFYNSQNQKDDIKFVNYYKNLTKNEKCIQILTDYLAIYYLLKKPSCTQFYSPLLIQNKITEIQFINQLIKSKPNFILLNSPVNLQTNKKNFPNVIEYLDENYFLYEKYLNQWDILKKK